MGGVLRVALAGQPNVGKSVIFNQLTGLHQHIGNWPGKTVEKAEGTLRFGEYTIDVIDLPGTYSLSAFTIEERIARDYIALERPDVVVNVVDSSSLERNLFLTLQVLELEVPTVVVLNQWDMAKKRGIRINVQKLEESLGVPVVPTVAVTGFGLHRLLERAIEQRGRKSSFPRYGREVEEKVRALEKWLEGLKYPPRWLALKLLEEDEEVEKFVGKARPEVLPHARRMRKELGKAHGERPSVVVAAERYSLAGRIAREVQTAVPAGERLSDRLDRITTSPLTAYPLLVLVMLSLFLLVFQVGGRFTWVFDSLVDRLEGLHWLPRSALEGILAAASVALPYIIPFYLLLHLLEDSGYMPRAAFAMDTIMHKMGLHGKAFIPAMLGFGCDVPACLGCRVMETEREKTLAVMVVTMVPCAATSAVILGLVGKSVGLLAVLLLYAIHFCIVFMLGRLLFKALPGEPVGLIMEMPPYRVPHLPTVLKETWGRTVEFLKIAVPLVVVGSVCLTALYEAGAAGTINSVLSPITEGWLGLPVVTGTVLLMGILRKEMLLILLAATLGTTNFSSVLTNAQILVFGMVSLLYLPCISTFAALMKEIGWKKAVGISLLRILLAVFVGGILYRVLCLFGG
jgi:ferrous iron transport protein B